MSQLGRANVRKSFVLGLLAATGLAGCSSVEPYRMVQNPGPIICKKFRPTGSHMPKEVCLPKSHWDQATRDAKAISDAIARGDYR